jgi:enoyl-CoA hydratase/carnithine racemase
VIDLIWNASDIATIRLNRPDKKNAMTPEMLDRFCETVAESRGRARAIIVCGAGDVFCSGFDLAMCLQDAGVLAALLKGLSRAIVALREHPAPVVAAAHGAAIAGGCALLCGADVVVTHDDAKFGYPVVRLGISPAVNAPFLNQSMGAGSARARLLDTQLISGREATRLGLAHECVPAAAETLGRAQSIAMELAAKPRSGLEATKAWLSEMDESADRDRIEESLTASLGLVGSPEERERLAKMFASSVHR